ncbi:MAG TPA: DHA2 family efflux MFS transporter permease subunit [Dongiaceae bacterium]|nr:DHA2 family efflux MFS transporter permease subunit [Dongiaceae bacterium]
MNRPLTARDWVGFMIMVFGMFMAILDIQIVSSSIAEIQAGLSATADEISWVQTSYLIAEVVMIPLTGILSRLFSTRVFFAVAAAGFTATSALCALAWDIDSMIIFRAAQGFLGGAMIPTVFATSFIVFPPEKRNFLSVLMGLVATMAPTLGPTLGGWLTQTFSWHWLFLANLLPGIVVTVGVWLLVDFDKSDRSLLKDFDYLGLLLMAVFLGCMQYAIEEGPRNDWLEDPAIRNAAAVSVVFAVLFFWRAFAYRSPIVDLRGFADKNFALGCIYSFIIGIGLYGSTYLTPVFLGQVRGFNALQIGEIMFVTGVFQFMSAPIAGRLAGKLDLRVMLAFGLLMFGGGVWMQSHMSAEWGFWEFFLPQAVRGFALMFLFIPINAVALGTLPPHRLKNASGLYNLMRNLGGAIGLAGINTIINDRLALHWARLVEPLTAGNPNLQRFMDGAQASMSDAMGESTTLASAKLLARLVHQQAEVLTLADTQLVMAMIFFAALLAIPLLSKPRTAPAKASSEAH